MDDSKASRSTNQPGGPPRVSASTQGNRLREAARERRHQASSSGSPALLPLEDKENPVERGGATSDETKGAASRRNK